MSTPVREMTVTEFETFVESEAAGGRWFELMDGRVVEKMPNEEHGEEAVNLILALGNYIRPRQLGRLVVEALYRPPGDEYNARQPDIAFTRHERLQPAATRGAASLIPDLCIEIKSPGNKISDLRDKAEFYLAHGGRMVWLVYPQQRIVEVFTEGTDVQILTEHDILHGGDVIEGFAMPVKDIFALTVRTSDPE